MSSGREELERDGPLEGLRVAVTRPGAGSPGDRLSRLIRDAGGFAAPFPLTRIVPVAEGGDLDRAVQEIEVYDWIVVTSARAVKPLSAAMERAARDPSQLPAWGVRVCAVGPRTAGALRDGGFPVDTVPERFAAEGVVDVMRDRVESQDSRILFPRAEGGRDVIPRELRGRGTRVEVVTAYGSVPEPDAAARLRDALLKGNIDVLTFTAGSAAAVFLDAWSQGETRSSPGSGTSGSDEESPRAVPETPVGVGVVVIGPATASGLAAAGIHVDGIAQPHSFEGLVTAIVEWRAEHADGAVAEEP
ncbi:MAG: uroporphyrinogen-III synthase [Gemmatimonadota bacterium]